MTILPTIDGIHTGVAIVPWHEATRAEIEAACGALPHHARRGILGRLCRAALDADHDELAMLQDAFRRETARVKGYAESELNRTGVALENAEDRLRRVQTRIAYCGGRADRAITGQMKGWWRHLRAIAAEDLPAAEKAVAEARRAFLAEHAKALPDHIRILEAEVR